MLNAICDWPIRLFSQELVLEPREQAHWIGNIKYHSHVECGCVCLLCGTSFGFVCVVLPEREQKMNRRFYDNLKDMEFDLLLQELLSYKA